MKVRKSNFESYIATIEAATLRSELMVMWRGLFVQPLPKNISLKLMKLAIAYRIQEKIFGGLGAMAVRYLNEVATTAHGGRAASRPEEKVAIGTRFIRQWRSKTYEAVVDQDGVLVNGERFNSLSEAARSITGAHWSGPRFFGLRKVKTK